MQRELLNRRAHSSVAIDVARDSMSSHVRIADESESRHGRVKSSLSIAPNTHDTIGDGDYDQSFNKDRFHSQQQSMQEKQTMRGYRISNVLSRNAPLLVIIAVSFATRFYRLEYPKQTVFDEVHFGYFAGSYIKGEHYFDIHPPCSKLILAFFGWLGGYDGHFDFDSSNPYDGDWYMSLRFMPAFSGSLHAPLTYLTMKEMHASELASILAATAVIVDMCMLLEARIIVTDALLMLFVISAFYFHVRAKNIPMYTGKWYRNLLCCGIFIGACISSKWTALATMGIIGMDVLVGLLASWRKQDFEERLLSWISYALLLFVVPLLFYFFMWVLHIHYLPKTGKGDPWMSHEFRKNLIGNEEPAHIQPKGLIDSIIEFQYKLYVNNKGIVEPHNWMTAWWSWPVLVRGLAFWGGREESDPPGTRRYIYLLGNPLVWWFATATVVFFLGFVFYIPYRITPLSEGQKRFLKTGALLLGAYIFNWLPFILIARVTFLYHYMPSLYFSILLVGHTLDCFFPKNHPNRVRIFVLVGLIFVGTFLYHSPCVYAFPLTPAQRDARRWFSTWT
eukprot:TRINITY_DN8606_c0_g1_i2.p1 TRINITY_DN8606_c0_g1~~TRINITY_DN8606_c0_g1_i2.p1  ORF type:complete len:562 (+),score=86.98 TRINITY_DN8606_c0_g1_i2:62-1747(+)